MPLSPSTDDDLHQWGWEMGSEAGRRLAEESNAWIGITLHPSDAPASLRTYSRAFLRAFVSAYRIALTRYLSEREDVATAMRRGSASPEYDERTSS